MTDRNRSAAIVEELARAESAERASSLLAEQGYLQDAVSRLYYSLLFRVRALLLTQDMEPRSHEGALRLLSLHFVKTGKLSAEDSHVFTRLMKYREEADYNPSYTFTTEDMNRLQAEAAALSRKIIELIHPAR